MRKRSGNSLSEAGLRKLIAAGEIQVIEQEADRKPTPAAKAIKSAKQDTPVNRFLDTWRLLGGPDLVDEYQFHKVRKFRFDFAHLRSKVYIEIDGGTWIKGPSGHASGKGITRDCTKQNLAVINGWRPFRLTTDMLSKRNAAGNILPIIEYIRAREKALQFP